MTRSNARAALVYAARACLFFGAACGDPAPRGPVVVSFQKIETHPDFGAVSVSPLNPRGLATLEHARLSLAEWQKILEVHAGDSAGLPMIGSYSVAHDSLRFTPRFPPIRGTTYTARFDGPAFSAKSGAATPAVVANALWMRKLASGAPTTSVEAVYPTTDSVPMNLLRMYVQFSGPMTVGDDADKYIRLLDDHGAVVDKAFLVATGGQELWDPAHTRLTIFFDPGRIKRDLTPHDALGLPLRNGHSYTLVIDSTLRDEHGLPMAHGFTKRFRVGPVDRTLPRTSAWRVVTPKVGTLEPLTIEFPKPLDHALLGRMLTVKRVAGTARTSETSVVGRAEAGNGDRRWTFTPTEPWSASSYDIDVDTELEDLAGNNMKHLFDVMPGDLAARGVDGPLARIPFTLGVSKP